MYEIAIRYLSNFLAAAGRRCRCLDDEDGVGGQRRLELGVVDAARLLYLAAVMTSVFVRPCCLHDDPVAVSRHADTAGVEASHVKADLVTTAGVRIIEIQRLHFLFVEYVGAATTARYQRISQHLITAPLHVDRIQPQKLISVMQSHKPAAAMFIRNAISTTDVHVPYKLDSHRYYCKVQTLK